MTYSGPRSPSYSFPHVRPHQFIHPSAKVDIHPDANVNIGHINIGPEATFIVGAHSEINDCRINVAAGAKLNIGRYCRLLQINILMQRRLAVLNIGNYTAFAPHSLLMADNRIDIGDYFLSAMNVMIVDSQIHSLDWAERIREIEQWRHREKTEREIEASHVIIGDACWLCYNVSIPGAKAGEKLL